MNFAEVRSGGGADDVGGSEADHYEIYVWDLEAAEGVESDSCGGCGGLPFHGCRWKEVSGFFGAADVRDAGSQE
jgi:hypothetical protein